MVRRFKPDVRVVGNGDAWPLAALHVEYRDTECGRLDLAARIGAQAIEHHGERPTCRFPITVDASADSAGLEYALMSTSPRGVCTSVGIYYTRTTPISLLAMYGSGVTFVTGPVNTPACLPEVLDLVVRGRLHPEQVTSLVAPWSEPVAALLDPDPKVVIAR